MGMTLMSAVVQLLSNSTVVTPVSSGRVYPMRAARGVSMPYVTVQKISNPVVHASGRDPGLRHPRVQVTTFAESYSEARDLSRRVKAVLQDFTSADGLMGDATSGVLVQRAFFNNETDLPVIMDPDTREVYLSIAQDYIIWAST